MWHIVIKSDDELDRNTRAEQGECILCGIPQGRGSMVIARESDTMIKTIFICSVCIQAIAKIVERNGSPVKWNQKVMSYQGVPLPEVPEEEQQAKGSKQ